jgi:uncharacterized membrane protein YeaQ/YmgE (transglycosylase-associated protein family)
MNLISFLILGLIAGWLAETIMKGRGAGLVVNLVLGVIGGLTSEVFFSACLACPLKVLLDR